MVMTKKEKELYKRLSLGKAIKTDHDQLISEFIEEQKKNPIKKIVGDDDQINDNTNK